MKELVILVEEQSAKAMLESLLPRFIDISIGLRIIPFEGKNDLEKQVMKRLRGYLNPQARFLVLRDQDSNPDCAAIKRSLMQKCIESGKEGLCLVRIACTELETIYLADLAAVEEALVLKGLSDLQERAKFRSPDRLGSPSRELEVLTKGAYQKVSGSRAIGKYLDVDNVRSPTFRNLVQGIKKLERELLLA